MYLLQKNFGKKIKLAKFQNLISVIWSLNPGI